MPNTSFAQYSMDNLIESIDELLELEVVLFRSASDEEILEKAKENMSNKLRDPMSANFQRLRVIRKENAIYVCGKVNAKNLYGAYTGFKWFFATPIALVKTEADNIQQSIIVHYCSQ